MTNVLPPNAFVGGAISINDQQTTIVIFKQTTYLLPQSRFFTLTVPEDGGLVIVIGDAMLPGPTSYMYVNITKPGGLATPYGYRSVYNPTAGLIERASAGDVYAIEVVSYSPDGEPVMLRWCVTNDVVWGDWQDSSESETQNHYNPGTCPYQRPWGYGDDGMYLLGMLMESRSVSMAATTATSRLGDGEQRSHADDFGLMRDAVENDQCQLQDGPAGGGTPTPTSRILHDHATDEEWNGYRGSVGYHGQMFYDAHPGFTWFIDNEMDVNIGAIEYTMNWLYNFEENELVTYAAVISQAPINDLKLNPWTLGAGVVLAAIKNRPFEWKDGDTPHMNMYRSLSMTWNTQIEGMNFYWDPQPLYDAMTLKVHDATGIHPLEWFAESWRTPGDFASIPTIITHSVPQNGSVSGSWQETTDIYTGVNWDTPIIEDVDSAVPLVYAFDTSTYSDGTPIDGEYIAAHERGLFGTPLTTWVMNGSINFTPVPGMVYPDYRLGTYIEHLSPLGVPPLRQRARNDGLASDSQQQVSHDSSQQKKDLWWVGRKF